MVCKKCGVEVADNARFCGGCGSTIKQGSSNIENVANAIKNKAKVKINTAKRFIVSVLSILLLIFVMVAGKPLMKILINDVLYTTGIGQTWDNFWYQGWDKIASLVRGTDENEETEDKTETDGKLNIIESFKYIRAIKNASLNDYPDSTIHDMFDVVFTDVDYTAYEYGNSIPLVVIEGDHDDSHYIVTFMLIGDKEFKKRYGVLSPPFYSDEFYIAHVVVDRESIFGDDFVNILSDFYDNQ